ncbi:MAG: GTPase ObgE [Anaerolineales bacterium]
MFYDQAEIYVRAGRGGDGIVTFRREKYIPFGGPSGGDGGRGGDVVLEVNPHLNTLYHFARQREFVAEDGERGGAKDQHGAAGADLIVPVPPGTLVTDQETGAVIADLTEEEQRVVIAKGGRGGRGNARFATATNQAPRVAEKGDPGEERSLKLELKLLADVGLVGMPNAGKSTLLSVTTAARPKIAPYPFTTLQPNLGVVALSPSDTFVLADLPGLIEGASQGKGLGHEFLRHIERTRVVLHVLDGTEPDPLGNFEIINAELEEFGHGLMDKPQIVAINKLDMPEARARYPELQELLETRGYEVHGISAIAKEGMRELMGRAYQILEETPLPEVAAPQAPAVIRPDFSREEEGFVIERGSEGTWRVRGGKIERAVQRTNLGLYEGLMRLHRYLESKGVIKALRDAGVQEGDSVRIGDYEMEWSEEF